MLFANVFKREPDVSIKDDLAILSDEVRKINARLSRLDAEILDLATSQDIIRNKVLRKIQNKKEEETSETWNGLPLG